MVCRETRLGSLTIALAKVESGLDDVQVQSLMHRLRHEHAGAGGDSRIRFSDQQAVVDGLAAAISTHPRLSARRRTTLLGKLGDVHSHTDVPDDLMFAAAMLRPAAAAAAYRLDTRLREHAAATGEPARVVAARFDQLRRDAPGGRQRRATPAEKQQLTGLPTDPATRHAFTALAAEPGGAPPPPVPVQTFPTTAFGARHAGYDPDTGRAEVHLVDGRRWRFANVTPDTGRDLTGQDPQGRERALRELLRDPVHHQGSQPTAAAPYPARRCPGCGQWAGDRAHTCPVVSDPGGGQPPVPQLGAGSRQVTLTSSRGWLVGPDPALAHLAMSEHPQLDVEVHGEHTGQVRPEEARDPYWAQYAVDRPLSRVGFVSGRARLTAGPTPAAAVTVDPDGLTCSCFTDHPADAPGHRCAHIATATALLAESYRPPPPVPRDWDPRPPHPVAGTAAPPTARALTVQALTGPGVAPDLSTVRYATDPAAFAADLHMVNAYADDHPEDPVPLLTEHAVYGYGQGRTFGVELEFDDPHPRDGLDGHGVVPAVSAVTAQLHDQGLTTSSEPSPYHSAADSGWQQWTVELDSSVAGEAVSPPLSDRPADWAALATACAAIRSAAGHEHSVGGSHVHVDATGYGGNEEAVGRLIRLTRYYVDELHQIGTQPGSERDRLYGSFPHPRPPDQLSTAWLRRTRGNRSRTVNFGHVREAPDDAVGQSRLEFRLWDGSAQPGRVQAQIKVSLALAGYALHHDSPRESVAAERVLGNGGESDADLRLTQADLDRPDPDDPGWLRRTARTRELLDLLFRRDQDKQQVLAAWASGTVDRIER